MPPQSLINTRSCAALRMTDRDFSYQFASNRQQLVAAGFSLRWHRLEGLGHHLTATRYQRSNLNLGIANQD
jgi:hypothetical protein